MGSKHKCKKLGFLTILCALGVLMLCTVPCSAVITVDSTNTPYTLNTFVDNNIDVINGGTIKIEPEGYAKWGVSVDGGSIEIYGSHTWTENDENVNVDDPENATLFTDSTDTILLNTSSGPDATLVGTTIIVDTTSGWTGKLTWEYIGVQYSLNISTLSDIVVEVVGGPEQMLFDLGIYIQDQVEDYQEPIPPDIEFIGIAPELEVSLLAKVYAAAAALARGNPNDAKVAMNDLKALVKQVEAQMNKKISEEAAEMIISSATAISSAIGGL